MILHQHPKDFNELVLLTTKALKIRDIFIEKDYWVTFILWQLSKSEFQDDVVFKGGTSLSKAYDLAKRFSEDIDLVLLEKKGMTGGKIKTLLKKIEESLIVNPLVEDTRYKSSKGSKIRKTGYSYPNTLGEQDFGHATKTLILELNAFANPSPVFKMPIESYIAQFLKKNKNEAAIKKFGLESFEINVLHYTRTFMEKLMGLTRVSINIEKSTAGLQERVRHFYDLHKLFMVEEIALFIKSDEFKKMARLVLDDDLSNPEFQKDWTIKMLREAPLFTATEAIFKQITGKYNDEFKLMLYQNEETKISEIKGSFEKFLALIPDMTIRR